MALGEGVFFSGSALPSYLESRVNFFMRVTSSPPSEESCDWIVRFVGGQGAPPVWDLSSQVLR